MIEVQAEIQALSLVESLVNPIDQLAVLDAEIKRLEVQAKSLKADITNTYGEGKHRGEKYGVSISLYETSKVDYKGLLAELGATEEQVARFTSKNAVIRVSSTN
jgi:uncharacterized protein (UPF0335 family)